MHLKRKFNILFSLIKEYFVQTKLFRLIFIIIIKKFFFRSATIVAATTTDDLAFTFIVHTLPISLSLLPLFFSLLNLFRRVGFIHFWIHIVNNTFE